MITGRDLRLVRVPHLRAAHRAMAALATLGEPLAVRRRVVLVPTRHAAHELRRTLEQALLIGGREPPSHSALLLPALLTRDDFYDHLHASLGPGAPPLLRKHERLALLWRASDTAVALGTAPPFGIRPGLIGEMLALYDGLRRNQRTVDDFERVLTEALEPGADTDRGASRLLAQTHYLTAAFREYERLTDASARVDEHRLRRLLADVASPSPVEHVIVTLADQGAEADGLWPADFDLLTRMPGLVRVDVIATEALLDAGLRQRLHDRLPGIEETAVDGASAAEPTLLSPGDVDGRRYFLHRDREDEVTAIAARLQASRGAGAPAPDLADVLIVYQRPLPYVYLVRRVFEDAGVPCELADTLPLAAEPFAAALDLVLEAVLSDLGREPLLELLASPVLTWRPDGRPLAQRDVAALDDWWRAGGFRGGFEAIEQLAAGSPPAPPTGSAGVRLRRALDAARAAAADLVRLGRGGPLSGQFASWAALLKARRVRGVRAGAGEDERFARARQGTLALLDELARAHAGEGDRVAGFRDAVAIVRRALEERTFAPLDAGHGARLVDARTAQYADAADVWLVGVVEGEWPSRTRTNIFYPSGLLRDLGFALDQDRVAAARARFHDLLRLARARVAVSAFQLEEDAIVRPSVLVEDLEEVALAVHVEPTGVPVAGGGLEGPHFADARTPRVVTNPSWLALRTRRSPADHPRFHGQAGPPPAAVPTVTAIERYLECPFKYFASSVLDLDEEPGAEDVGLDPRRRGTVVHEVFEVFFREWAASGRSNITPASLPEARARFAEVVGRVLASLPEPARVIERARLVGSAVAPGLGEGVFRLEALRPTPVVDRLLEINLRGTYDLGVEHPHPVALRGKADRVDLLADGTFRLIDYKTGRAPAPARAIQLAIYALCAEQHLDGHLGRRWTIGEAAYIAMSDKRPWVGVVRHAGDREPLELGRRRFLAALDGIAHGDFPPAPADRRLCSTCAFAAVCRKDYVGRLA